MRRVVLGAGIAAVAAATTTAAVLAGTSTVTATHARSVSYSVPDAGAASGGWGRSTKQVYLSLGDSLAVGVQPDAQGTDVPTRQGYANQLYASLQRYDRGLRLVKLGCPGETTGTMANGGICSYQGGAQTSDSGASGSQLAAATSYLAAHPGRVSLITVDIGANDLNPCLVLTNASAVKACVGQVIPAAEQNLTGVLAGLRFAGYDSTIVGMTYYDPELADWLTGADGQQFAQLSEQLLVAYNSALTAVYQKFGAKVADVFSAFDTSDFSTQVSLPGIGSVPANVANICTWTWECAAPPRGPNEHATEAGYATIARTFLRTYLAGR